MSYPDYPNNRLIVNGVDLTLKFKMALMDGYTMEPPETKTYTVDIPGRNGPLDLTETLIGDATYGNRKQEFSFYVFYPQSFEETKTEVSNFLHGKAYDYQLTMDPGYTYHGRFSVTSYEHAAYAEGIVGVIKVEIDAEPYKRKADQIFRTDAVGGTIVNFMSGRMRVRPTIETDGFTKVIYNHKLLRLPQGTWTINDLLFTNGSNPLYFNTYDIRNIKWKDLKENTVTWGQFKKRRLFEWYKSNGDGTYVIKRWSELFGSKWFNLDKSLPCWSSFSNFNWSDLYGITWSGTANLAEHGTYERWVDLSYMIDVTSKIKNIYTKYKWGDL